MPGYSGWNGSSSKIDDAETPKLQVVKQQIEFEIFSAGFDGNLAADKGEMRTEFLRNRRRRASRPRSRSRSYACEVRVREVEIAEVFDEVLGKIRLRNGEPCLKVWNHSQNSAEASI